MMNFGFHHSSFIIHHFYQGRDQSMEFEYTGRHVDVTPALRAHVEDHFQKLEHIFTDTTARAHVIIEVEKNRQIGEVLVHWREHTLTATDTNADMYLALTRAIAKIEKQALKLKKKIIDRKQGAKRVSAVAPEPDGQVEASPRPPRIIAARRYIVKPMTAEEAALRLSEESDQFLVFRDADTNRVGVIYQRKDGNYGLIEP
jgi:putative sigma-54 modulation protein